MRTRKGFTLIELMIVILIVAVLAAVLVPLMRSRIEAAKWSEGKAGAGTIATAIRAYAAEVGENGQWNMGGAALKAVLFPPASRSDLDGKYFKYENYLITTVGYTATVDPPLTYLITVNAPLDFKGETSHTLNHLGYWDYETQPQ
jgi:prepilin-type N-terminal cleavage/methylation domain-containing protein